MSPAWSWDASSRFNLHFHGATKHLEPCNMKYFVTLSFSAISNRQCFSVYPWTDFNTTFYLSIFLNFYKYNPYYHYVSRYSNKILLYFLCIESDSSLMKSRQTHLNTPIQFSSTDNAEHCIKIRGNAVFSITGQGYKRSPLTCKEKNIIHLTWNNDLHSSKNS